MVPELSSLLLRSCMLAVKMLLFLVHRIVHLYMKPVVPAM